MKGIEIIILGVKYVFYGISEELAAEIRRLAATETFQEDFKLWEKWLQSKMRKADPAKADSKDDIIIVCDPYGMMGQDTGNVSWQQLAGTEIPEKGKPGIIEKKAETAVNALVGAMGGDVRNEVNIWQQIIQNIFTAYVREDIGKIYGIQCTNQSSRSCSSAGPFRTVLFIDFASVMKDTPGLLLPTIMHETTHFLEEMTISNGHAIEEAKKNGVEIPDEIWDADHSGSMGSDDKWAKIFHTQKEYQATRPQEQLTTLVEKMTAGSLYEVTDRGWVDNMLELFKAVLAGNGII